MTGLDWDNSLPDHQHDEDDDDELTILSGDGVREGKESILKKDEKLRRLLGDNFTKGYVPIPSSFSKTSSPTSSSPSSRRSPDTSRQRVSSSTSSTAQLIPQSPTITFNETLERTFGEPANVPLDPDAVYLPETTNLVNNTLSAEARRGLVKRTKKLGQIYGRPLGEGILRRSSEGKGREDSQTMSTSADPTNIQSFDASRRRLILSSTSSFRRSSLPESPDRASLISSATTFEENPPFSSFSVAPFSTRFNNDTDVPLSPRSILSFGPAAHIPASASTSTMSSNIIATSTPTYVTQDQREARRRKIAKLQDVLGERVPAHLVFNTSPRQHSSSDSSRSNSLGAIFKDRLAWSKRDESSEANLDIAHKPSDSQVNTQENPEVGSMAGLVKTRKMEQLFGDVPPSSLYLSRSTTLNRRQSETQSLHYLYNDSNISTDPDSPHSRQSDTSVRYRRSIASLRYLIEEEPTNFEALAKEYSANLGSRRNSNTPPLDENDTIDLEAERVELRSFLRDSMQHSTEIPTPTSSNASEFSLPSDPPLPDSPSTPPSSRLSPNASSGSHRRSLSVGSHRRTIARAAKLSNFFGTSRGLVWKVLLDDLSDVIREESDLEEEERAEVLEGVARLRMSAGHY